MDNQIIRSLMERRSCRSYRKEQITDDELNAVLEAGEYAPSAMGRQSTKMVVLQNPDDIARLSAMNARIMGTDKDPFYGAPTVVIVFADRSILTCVEDGSLVLGNLMNAAHAIGLGSCWIGFAESFMDLPEIKERFHVPAEYRIVSTLSLGYAKGHMPEAQRKEPRIFCQG